MVDPQLALEAFRAQSANFDLLLLDLAMPHMSGLELAAAVRAIAPHTPVILTSGYFSTEDERVVNDLGIAQSLPKPYDMQTLKQAIANQLEESLALENPGATVNSQE